MRKEKRGGEVDLVASINAAENERDAAARASDDDDDQ